MAESSPTLPPLVTSEPVYIKPFKKVPVVRIVFFANTSSLLAITPFTKLSLTIKSVTSASITKMFVFFSIFCTASL